MARRPLSHSVRSLRRARRAREIFLRPTSLILGNSPSFGAMAPASALSPEPVAEVTCPGGAAAPPSRPDVPHPHPTFPTLLLPADAGSQLAGTSGEQKDEESPPAPEHSSGRGGWELASGSGGGREEAAAAERVLSTGEPTHVILASDSGKPIYTRHGSVDECLHSVSALVATIGFAESALGEEVRSLCVGPYRGFVRKAGALVIFALSRVESEQTLHRLVDAVLSTLNIAMTSRALAHLARVRCPPPLAGQPPQRPLNASGSFPARGISRFVSPPRILAGPLLRHGAAHRGRHPSAGRPCGLGQEQPRPGAW